MEDPDAEGEYLELRNGGIDILDDTMDEAVESVGESMEEVSEYGYLAWGISHSGERGMATAVSLLDRDRRAVLRLYSLLGLTPAEREEWGRLDTNTSSHTGLGRNMLVLVFWLSYNCCLL